VLVTTHINVSELARMLPIGNIFYGKGNYTMSTTNRAMDKCTCDTPDPVIHRAECALVQCLKREEHIFNPHDLLKELKDHLDVFTVVELSEIAEFCCAEVASRFERGDDAHY
jgi:hypothetical protein